MNLRFLPPLIIAAVTLGGYLSSSLPKPWNFGRHDMRSVVFYEDCGQRYSLPMRDGRTVPIAELEAKERNFLLLCAIESGNADLVRQSMNGAKEPLSIPYDWRVNGRKAVELVASWSDGEAAVGVLKLLLEPNPNFWRIDRSGAVMVGAYEAASVEVARYFSRSPSFVLEENNRSYFDSGDYANYFGLTLAQYHAFKGRLAVAEHYAGKGVRVATPNLQFRHWLLHKDRSRLLDPALDAFLSAHGVPRDERGSDGRTVLHMAASLGDEVLVAFLLERGANAGIADNAGDMPLHGAAKSNHQGVIKRLIGKANPETRNHRGQTPLHLAFASSSWGAASLLLDNGAKLDAADTLGRTPIFDCIRQGCPMLDRIVASGGDLEGHDKSGNSLLHEAALAEGGGIEMTQGLVARGVRVSRKNLEGQTALHFASARNNPGLTQLLVEQGAAVNERDNLGNTPLHLARSAEVAAVLLDGGANPDLSNKAGIRPVNGTFERSRMLFYSPELIHGKADSLPRYFVAIRAASESGQSDAAEIKLLTPTKARIGIIAGDGDMADFAMPVIEFVPRAANLEFRVQVACEVAVALQAGNEILALNRLPTATPWEDLQPVDGLPRSFQVPMKPEKCAIPALDQAHVLAALKRQSGVTGDNWLAIAKTCGAAGSGGNEQGGGCTVVAHPLLRVLVKNGKFWKEAGGLHTGSKESRASGNS